MKQITGVLISGTVLLFALMQSSCNKDVLPTLKTLPVSEISSTTAKSGGDITDDGGSDIISKGIVWSTQKDPTLENHLGITEEGVGKDGFSSTLTNLNPETRYYVRAYAANGSGTAYGSPVEFTTRILAAGSPCPGMPTVADYNGNIYNTVQIGNQCWMKENLKANNYNNGTAIPIVTLSSDWINLSTDARCWYNNDSATYAAAFGALYNWQAVDHSAGLCPEGWHVPTDAEWWILTSLLGGPNVAGAHLKETGALHWPAPNAGATDSSGFTARPGGYRLNTDGAYVWMRCNGNFWSSTATTATGALARTLHWGDNGIHDYNVNKNNGFSVRCIKD